MKKTNALLWTIQVLLALLFLFAGGMKLVTPIEQLPAQLPLSGTFRFIGFVEVLGAFGLILPGLTHIQPSLTPLAAAGLMIIMIGATVLTFGTAGAGAATMPLAVGALSAFVTFGRWRLTPHATLKKRNP